MSQPAMSAPLGVASRSGINAQVILSLHQPSVTPQTMVFPVTPNQVTAYNTARTTPTQTIQGIFIDDFGAGYNVITLQGDSGYWRSNRGSLNGVVGLDGFTFKNALEQIFYFGYFSAEGSNLSPNPNVQMYLKDTYSGRNFVVKPYQDFQITQDTQEPLNFDYTLTFLVLANANQAQSLKVARF